jgi:DnaK suppressor protein
MRMATKNASKADKPLTEADILKMPEKDYMNEAQLAFFRDLLVRMRDDILRKADETVEHMREVDNVSDPADRATVEEEHTLELRTRDRERKLLKKIEQAIERIDAGEYGYCDETGEPIGIRRLLARPTATLTIEAQERRERLQKLYGD